MGTGPGSEAETRDGRLPRPGWSLSLPVTPPSYFPEVAYVVEYKQNLIV